MHCRFAAAGMLAFLSFSSAALAGECAGNPDALGTSRVISLDPAEFKRLGTIQYKQSLPLEDHEVVLTFDDGPIPPHTDKVLDALAAECVKATFFVVGEMARAHPEALRREYREGHTIGTHTEHHARLDRMPAEKAQKEISDGLASAAQVLDDKNAVAPFFRFPYLDHTGAVEERAEQLGLSIWSADLHASDWTFITAEKVTALALSRLEAKKKGILLLHDIHDRTAKALPVLLRELKKKGYRIVQVAPASGAVAKIEDKPDAKTPAKPEQTAVASSDEKTPAKTEQAALAHSEQTPAEKPKQATHVNLDAKSQKNAEGGWRTRLKRRKVTAEAKPDALQSLIRAFWHR
jgi:peptidoglycan/xylan/chitin deacetylase (PgdA/CDA1 family)